MPEEASATVSFRGARTTRMAAKKVVAGLLTSGIALIRSRVRHLRPLCPENRNSNRIRYERGALKGNSKRSARAHSVIVESPDDPAACTHSRALESTNTEICPSVRMLIQPRIRMTREKRKVLRSKTSSHDDMLAVGGSSLVRCCDEALG
jgi:hypothetical protein